MTPAPELNPVHKDPSAPKVVEVYGDGTAEVSSKSFTPQKPTRGVLVILLRRLCDLPLDTDLLLVVPMRPLQLQKKGSLAKRVWLAKRAAATIGRDGFVFVQDTEGEPGKQRLAEIRQGCGQGLLDFPVAMGVVVPCIESWLLADGSAIKRGMILNQRPTVPDEPEKLYPVQSPGKDYKRHLAQLAGANKKDLASEQKGQIAEFINLDELASRCPSFRDFADEVKSGIAVRLFAASPDPSSQYDQGEEHSA